MTITCFIRYEIDPFQRDAFAEYARSWLRIIDPKRPSPLASLMLEVSGAFDYVTGANGDAGSVGLRADGDDVTVDLERPGSDFPAIVAGPSFAVVPPSIDKEADPLGITTFVGSGGYVLSKQSDTQTTLTANDRYYRRAAGARAILAGSIAPPPGAERLVGLLNRY